MIIGAKREQAKREQHHSSGPLRRQKTREDAAVRGRIGSGGRERRGGREGRDGGAVSRRGKSVGSRGRSSLRCISAAPSQEGRCLSEERQGGHKRRAGRKHTRKAEQTRAQGSANTRERQCQRAMCFTWEPSISKYVSGAESWSGVGSATFPLPELMKEVRNLTGEKRPYFRSWKRPCFRCWKPKGSASEAFLRTSWRSGDRCRRAGPGGPQGKGAVLVTKAVAAHGKCTALAAKAGDAQGKGSVLVTKAQWRHEAEAVPYLPFADHQHDVLPGVGHFVAVRCCVHRHVVGGERPEKDPRSSISRRESK